MSDFRTRYPVIIKTLMKEKNPLTAAALAAASGVSVRTVKNDIYGLNRILKPYGARILSKSGLGYYWYLEEKARIEELSSLLHTDLNDSAEEIFRYDYERIYHLIQILLMARDYVKAEDLLNRIFVSRSTLTQDLKKCRILIARFRLKLVSRANYGIRIEGMESDKRLCIAEYFFRSNENFQVQILLRSEEKPDDWIKERMMFLAETKNVCRCKEIMMSEFLASDFATHMLVALIRCRTGCFMDGGMEDYGYLLSTSEYQAAQYLTGVLETLLGHRLPLEETLYCALQLWSKSSKNLDDLTQSEHHKLRLCVDSIFEEIRDNFELDLRQDQIFTRYLYEHIGHMILRLKNHMIVPNPLRYEHLRRYLFASKVTHSANGIIEKYYDVELDNNEFAYLVPSFNLSITRIQEQKRLRMGFISGTGMPESFMYFNELLINFSVDKYEIIWVNSFEEAAAIDDVRFLISVYPLPLVSSIPAYRIHNGNFIAEIRESLTLLQYHLLNLDQYFQPDYACCEIEGSTKEEVLENFRFSLYERGLLRQTPASEPIFRSNEIGGGIVHIQDAGRVVKRAGYLIGILKSPIFWEQDIVRVLVMVKTKRDGDKNLYLLCDMLSRWAGSPEKVERLIRTRNYQEFKRDMIDYRSP